MTHTVSAMVQTFSRQAAVKESAPAAAPDAPAVANGATRFPHLFRALSDDADAIETARDGAAVAEESGSYATADGETLDPGAVTATLTVMTMPVLLNLPALAMAPVQQNADAQAATTAAMPYGAVDGIPALKSATLAIVLPQADVQSSPTDEVTSSDTDPAPKAPVSRPGFAVTNPAVHAAPLDQGVSQVSAALPGDAVNAGMQAHRAVSLVAAAGNAAVSAPDASRIANMPETKTETATGVARSGLPSGAVEFAPALLATVATAGGSQQETIKLAGAPAQWQQPLREALGERLQVQLSRNSEHAVIRLDPPMLGRIEISIRHEAGALQVHMSASNGDVVRQLQGIGESLRQDLIHRQYTDVAVVVSASSRNVDADGAGRQRQGNPGREDKGPGRALSEADQDASAFAFLTDSE